MPAGFSFLIVDHDLLRPKVKNVVIDDQEGESKMMEKDMETGMPSVINRHVWKGRYPATAIYIGRPTALARRELARGAADATALGNPFTLTQHGEHALALYRQWLWRQICEGNMAVLQALRTIRPDSLLVCSCAPRPCHGDIVVRAWRWLSSQEP